MLDRPIPNLHYQSITEPTRRLSAADRAVPPSNASEKLELLSALFVDANAGQAGFLTRRLFVSGKGHMGLAPRAAISSDLICVLLGGEVPYILRRLDRGYYRLVGEW
jgi:hypothetical protein